MYTRDRILCNVIYRNLSIVIYRSHLYGEHSISLGLNHFSISVGSKRKVDMLTEQLRFAEYKIVEEPRTTVMTIMRVLLNIVKVIGLKSQNDYGN